MLKKLAKSSKTIDVQITVPKQGTFYWLVQRSYRSLMKERSKKTQNEAGEGSVRTWEIVSNVKTEHVWAETFSNVLLE